MRIAYIAPYQGKALVKERPTVINLSLAARVKIELISELLEKSRHDVEVFSQGEVVERQFKFYPAFNEPYLFSPNIPVSYCSALPIKPINGLWSSLQMLRSFKKRHRAAPFDLVIIYNLKLPQMFCALHAIRHLNLPVILDYEDDAFVDVLGKTATDFRSRCHLYLTRTVLESISGSYAVSPHLLSQLPASLPKLLLRGMVGDDILSAGKRPISERKNWVVFSGTHSRTKGIEQLIEAWKLVDLPDWELHIAGHGEITAGLEKSANNNPRIIFHGPLNKEENARLLGSTKIAMNPHDLSDTPGNVFAFKIIEYLAAGAHVVTTPMGPLEPELEDGITYMSDNSPQTIATTLKRLIEHHGYHRTATQPAQERYGPSAVRSSLVGLFEDVLSLRGKTSNRKPGGREIELLKQTSGRT